MSQIVRLANHAGFALVGAQALRFDFPTARIARYIKLELEQNTGGLWWRIDELRVLQ